MELATLAVQADNPQGWMLINAADFDPEQHRFYDGLIHEPPPLLAEESGPLVEPSAGIGGHTLTQLRALATAEKIPGRSQMDRDELLIALQEKGYEL
jgi:hypothetical protein